MEIKKEEVDIKLEDIPMMESIPMESGEDSFRILRNGKVIDTSPESSKKRKADAMEFKDEKPSKNAAGFRSTSSLRMPKK